MNRRHPEPPDALRLWTDPMWIEHACDVYEHPGYRQARQTTRAFGRIMVDELEDVGGIRGLVGTVANMTSLAPEDFAARVPSVELKAIPKSKFPTGVFPGDVEQQWAAANAGALRPIVVPPLLRRALSVHLSEILGKTGDHLLPAEAIAYRSGRKDIVQRAILETAKTVRGGFTYWSKLDVKSFFPSVPWAGIEQALLSIGYEEKFVQYAMALIKGARAERVQWRTWITVETHAGAQAGLRESSIIANMFLSRLDREVLAQFPKGLFYRRYCDDMLLLGKTQSAVQRAVILVRKWLATNGLALKGEQQ